MPRRTPPKKTFAAPASTPGREADRLRSRLAPSPAFARSRTEPTWYPSRRFEAAQQAPGNLKELLACVQQAHEGGRRLKAYGSGHSSSDVAVPADTVVLTHRLSAALSTRGMSVARAGGGSLVRYEAGIKLADLNRELARRGLALADMPNFTGQSLAGAVSTASHGSGLAMGSLADQVVSIELVTLDEYRGKPRARCFRIEPTSGVTDPESFPAKADQELIQDDRTFYSSVVSFGCLGIIYAVTLKVREAFRLMQRHELVDLDRLSLAAPEVVADGADFLEIHALPRRDASGVGWQALVTRRDEMEAPPDGRMAPIDRLLDPMKSLRLWATPADLEEMAPLLPLLEKSLSGIDPEFGAGLSRHPAATARLYRRLFERRAGHRFYGPSPEILPLGIGDILETRAIEVALPLEQGPSGLGSVLSMAARWQGQGRGPTLPVGIRYAAPSRHVLAMSYGRTSLMLEVPVAVRVANAAADLGELEEGLAALQGRPHWGYLNHVSSARARSLYPKFSDARRAFDRFNRYGVFTNDFAASVFGD